jgi:ATPase subunit of ABC transporter with duplicated ATPase domains
VLDEPTNHLDLESIGFNNSLRELFKGSVILHHDHEFSQTVANRKLNYPNGIQTLHLTFDDYLDDEKYKN